MRKFISVCYIIIAVICSFFALYVSRDDMRYHHFMDNYGTHKLRIQIPYKTTSTKKLQLIDYLEQKQNTYDFSYFYISYLDRDKENLQGKFITYYFDTKHQEISQLFFKDEDNIKKLNHGDIITYKIGHGLSEIKCINFQKISSKQIDNLASFLFIQSDKDLDEFYSSYTLDEFPLLKESTSMQKQETITQDVQELQYLMQNALPIMVLVNLVILVLMLLDTMWKQKMIGIKKMHGDTNINIIKEMTRKDFILNSFLYAACGLGYFLCFNPGDNSIEIFIQSMLVLYIVQFCMHIIAILIMYIIIVKTSIITVIKGRIHARSLLWIIKLLKLTFVCLLSLIMYNTYETSRILYYEYRNSMELAKEYENKIQIKSFKGEYNLNDNFDYSLYDRIKKALMEEGYIYINASNYHRDVNEREYVKMAQGKDYDIAANMKKAVRVNESFIKKYKIHDCHGKEIHFDKKDRQVNPIVLIPESLWNSSDVTYMRNHANFSNVNFIKISNGYEVYTYSIEHAMDTNGFIKDAIFVIDGNETIYDYMIPIEDITKPREGLDRWLIEHDLETVCNYKLPLHHLVQLIQQKKDQMFLQIGFFIIACTGFLILLYMETYIYLKSKEKQLLVMRVHGYPFYTRYREVIWERIMMYLFVACVYFAVDHHEVLSMIMIMSGSDLVISGWLIPRLERCNISRLLKKEG